jgi:hypothetical protein
VRRLGGALVLLKALSFTKAATSRRTPRRRPKPGNQNTSDVFINPFFRRDSRRHLAHTRRESRLHHRQEIHVLVNNPNFATAREVERQFFARHVAFSYRAHALHSSIPLIQA